MNIYASIYGCLQAIAYEFTEQDIQELKDAVAAVEKRDLKVSSNSEMTGTD